MGTAELRQAYTEFFKTDDGRAFARLFGKSIPISNGYRRVGAAEEIEFCDPADLSRASMMDHPIDHIDPVENFSRLEGLTSDDIKSATAIFESAMRWCIDGVELVQMGRRAEIVISIMKPDLRYGLNPDKNAIGIFIAAHPDANADFALSGRLFGPVLEWLRRGHRGSELGERIMVLFYVLRPDLISNSTLASLGRISNKTRQAKDKLANCLRDHFSGIKARAMRTDVTRIRCRNSQLARM
jgi:hypothetical protein